MWRLLAPALVLTCTVWIALAVAGGGEHPVSAPWPVVAGLIAAAGVGLAVLTLVAARQSAIVSEWRAAFAEQATLTRFALDTASDGIVTMDRDGRIVDASLEAERMLGILTAEIVDLDAVETIVAPASRDAIRTRVRMLAGSAEAPSISSRAPTEMRRLDGTSFVADLLITATGHGAGRRIHLFARDTSNQLAAERAVTEHVEDLAALLHVARELSGSEAAQESRRAVCRAARQLSEGEFAHVFEFVAERNVLSLTAADGSGIESLELPLTRRSLLSDAFQSGQPMFSGDMLVDERADREAAARVGIRAGCFQPIIREGQTIGVLVVGWRQPIEILSPRVASLLALFATQVAAVLERADLIARLADLARTDSLTGLANRRALDESLIRELDRADRTGQPLSVALIDMDHFKRFNDERGHQAGDWLLAETARAWTRELRPTDTLGRYGGEEFVVVLPNCTAAAALHAIERLRGVVPAGQACSAGLATRKPGESYDKLIKRADSALYVAKRSGRNRTVAAASSASRAGAAKGATRRVARPPTPGKGRSVAEAGTV